MPIKISEIIIQDNRQRRLFEPSEIAELSRSIQTLGLLHPIVVRRSGDAIYLVAGERRLRAMKDLIDLSIPITHNEAAYLDGTVPVTFIDALSEEQAYEAELEENIIRVDLSWQERASAVARLHELRTAQSASRGEPQFVSQTAAEIAGTKPTSQDVKNAKYDIILAKHFDDPEVAKAASRKDALKVIEKKAKQKHREVLAQSFDTSKSKHTLHHADSFQLLATLPPESFDCLCTDPPYGMDATSFGSNFSTTHDYEDNWEYFQSIAFMLSIEAFRLLKPNTHAYVFCNFEGYDTLHRAFTSAGFKCWMQPLIWSKGNGNAPWINKGHKKSYECILFAAKGDRDVNIVKTDVLSYPPVTDREHGAEKPVALLADLLGRSTNPGDIILDPFAGSGSIFEAANLVSCKAVGIERDKDSFNIALTKL